MNNQVCALFMICRFSRRRRSLISQDSVESESPMLCLPGSGSTKRRFVYHQTADGESYPDEVGKLHFGYSDYSGIRILRSVYTTQYPNY